MIVTVLLESVLLQAIQKIVSETTKIEDVFVYANSAQIKDEEKLVQEIKTQLLIWKKKPLFKQLINFTFIPMNWKIELRI